jgi:HEAT repeat protein
LCARLEDTNRVVVSEAAGALGRFGNQAELAAQPLLAALRTALIDCDHSAIDVLAGSLLAVSREPKRLVRAYFPEEDLELRRHALEALKEQRARSRPEVPD